MREKFIGAVSRACMAFGFILLGLVVAGIGSNAMAGPVVGPVVVVAPGPCPIKKANGDCGNTCPPGSPHCRVKRDDTCRCEAV